VTPTRRVHKGKVRRFLEDAEFARLTCSLSQKVGPYTGHPYCLVFDCKMIEVGVKPTTKIPPEVPLLFVVSLTSERQTSGMFLYTLDEIMKSENLKQ
jgi:hypothetical protein